MRIFILDGNKMLTKTAAFDHIKTICMLPDYFGANLDALNDCLCEIDRNTVIILQDAEALRMSLGEYGDRMIEIFKENSEGSYVFVER